MTADWLVETEISTHAPRTGSDRALRLRMQPNGHFNPRSPHGERRRVTLSALQLLLISTHAPRTGSDAMSAMLSPKKTFQPTLPARGATSRFVVADCYLCISTHAPRTGSDAGF